MVGYSVQVGKLSAVITQNMDVDFKGKLKICTNSQTVNVTYLMYTFHIHGEFSAVLWNPVNFIFKRKVDEEQIQYKGTLVQATKWEKDLEKKMLYSKIKQAPIYQVN